MPTVSLHSVGKRIYVDYEAPNFYCTNDGDWPPEYTCTNDPEAALTRLSLFDSGGNVIRRAYVYFEKGTWDTGIDIGTGQCSDSGSYQASIKYLTSDHVTIYTVFSGVIPLTASPCRDRHECPGGTSAGLPINLGSGDVMVRQPLFSISQDPLSLPFTLTYHSSTPLYPTLVTEPVGKGWTHDYNQTLRPEDGTNNRLYHITPEGYEHEYLRISPDTSWIAISPAELRGTVKQVGSEYQLTDLDGKVTSFDLTTGHWNSTKDRWGNTITGTYTSGQLTTITDAEGRQVSLSYTSGQVTITLPDGWVWKVTLAGNLLTAIRDPLHPTSDWRTYSYVNDHASIQRLLSSIKDDASKELEAHTYDNVAGTGTDRGLTSSQASGTRSNVSIAYSDAANTRTVTHTIDGSTNQISTFNVSYIGARWLPTQISGNCATCGGTDADLQIFTYDYANHVIDKKDGSGGEQVETQYTYDGNGMLLSKIEAVGKPETRTTGYTYGYGSGTPSGGAPWPSFVTQVTETSVAKPGGSSKTTAYAWNPSGTPETTLTMTLSGYLLSTDTSQIQYTTTTAFDSKHRVASVAGPRPAQLSTMSYYPDNDSMFPDRRGRLSSSFAQTQSPNGLTTTYDNYDIFGTAKKLIDPNGVETDKMTDGKGRVQTVISKKPPSDPNEPGDYTTTYTYDSRDRLTDVTLPRGNKLHYDYEDGTNRLLDTIRVGAAGLQQERLLLTLNIIGDKIQEDGQNCGTPATNCTTWAVPSARTDSFSYDAHNRLSSTVHFDSTHIDYAYDSRGNLLTVKDENHSTANSTYSYDFLNRLIKVTQTLTGSSGSGGGCTSSAGQIANCYGYDAHDNLVSVTDPNGNQTTYANDDFRRVQKQVSPVTGTTTYGYNAAGDLTSVTDGNAANTTTNYDGLRRPLVSTSTRTGYTTETVTRTYDDTTAGNYGLGRLASMTDPAASTTYVYERRGLLRTEARTISGSLFNLSYGYDANGNRTSMTYPSGHVATYTVNWADLPNSLTFNGTGYVSSALYAPFGPETQLTMGNGTTRNFTYDRRYRPTENKLALGGTTIADYTYQEDSLGNITQVHDAINSAYNRDFSYDDLNRLTTANSGSSLWGTAPGNGYAYDKMGNMTSLQLGTSSTATFAYSGTLPKLSSTTETGFGTRSVAYDSAGNETAVGTGSFTYSTRNSLVTGDSLAYTYDGNGLRTIVQDSSGNKKYFFYSPEKNLLEETSLAPNPIPAGGYDYVWFGGHPMAEEDGGKHWMFTDHLGTPSILTDSTGGVFWRAEYEPYGKVFSLRTGTNQHQVLRLPGQEAEEMSPLSSGGNGATERWYNVFRWYRRRWGRYTQVDPIARAEESDPVLQPANVDPEVLTNLYPYVRGNPTGYMDPLGLLSFKGCSQDQQRAIAASFKDYCSRIESPDFARCSCKKPSIPGGLRSLCADPKVTVRCKANNRWPCGSDVCGWSLPSGRVIRLCPGAWQPDCGPLGCTLMHELTHMLGHPFEKWPKEVEKCLGCPTRD
jgi:RHS repeat-associated protein